MIFDNRCPHCGVKLNINMLNERISKYQKYLKKNLKKDYPKGKGKFIHSKKVIEILECLKLKTTGVQDGHYRFIEKET